MNFPQPTVHKIKHKVSGFCKCGGLDAHILNKSRGMCMPEEREVSDDFVTLACYEQAVKARDLEIARLTAELAQLKEQLVVL